MIVNYYIEVRDVLDQEDLCNGLKDLDLTFIDSSNQDPLCKLNTLAEVAVELHKRETQLDAAEVRGFIECLHMVRASVEDYLDSGGDIKIMQSIDRTIDRIVKELRECLVSPI